MYLLKKHSLYKIIIVSLFFGLAPILLQTKGLAVEIEPSNYRTPVDDADLQYWLENMVWYHQFSIEEIKSATGLSIDSINSALQRFNIYESTSRAQPKDSPLLVLPYPGGRHPRIGFLEGAIDPQRETKVSIFTPWDDSHYAVIDVPEAIWNNDRLIYLAHTHINTLWVDQGISLEPLEWIRHSDGYFEMGRELPNGIVFGTIVIPSKTEIRFQQWLINNTDKLISGLRVQNCLMLKNMPGFNQLSDSNNIISTPYIARHSGDGERWVITAFSPSGVPWSNPDVPCIHSNPTFPDCAPGETQKLRGWLSFYEGTNINDELNRISQIGWMNDPDY